MPSDVLGDVPNDIYRTGGRGSTYVSGMRTANFVAIDGKPIARTPNLVPPWLDNRAARRARSRTNRRLQALDQRDRHRLDLGLRIVNVGEVPRLLDQVVDRQEQVADL